MKYTEQEFKFDHIFDLIRYGFSSLFLAPFRFTNELSRKLPYIPQNVLIKISTWSIGIDVILIVIDLIFRFKDKNWSPISGAIPLVAYLLSLGILGGIYYFLMNWNQPKFKIVSDSQKDENRRKRKSIAEDGEAIAEPVEAVTEEKSRTGDRKGTRKKYKESELNIDNIDNLDLEGVSQFLDKDLEIDVSGIELTLDSEADIILDCEIPSKASESKINEAVATDKYKMSESSLNEIDLNLGADIEDLDISGAFNGSADIAQSILDLSDKENIEYNFEL